MKKIYLVLTLLVVILTAAYLLVGCGGNGDHAPGYAGEWSRSLMGGTAVYNLRADGGFTYIVYAGAPHASTIIYGMMGTYVVASGQITITMTHSYSDPGPWTSSPGTPESCIFSYIKGVSISIACMGTDTYDYYGPPTALPSIM
jgi:hypothetical protein